MIVKSIYIKKFGKLKDMKLSFNDGLNIIEGKNEAGKSTISAFLRFMLYGSPKDRQSKTNPVPEKEKYIPWDSDGTASGSITVEYCGRNIVIERDFKRSLNKGFSVYDEATAEPLNIFKGSEPGQVMFDISAETFERTAFIKQSDLVLGECSELEIKLRNLVTGADENVSFAAATKRLDELRRRLENSRGSGKIPDLRSKIDDLKMSLITAERLKDEHDKLRLKLKEMQNKKAELEKALTEHKAELSCALSYSKREKYLKIKAARQEQQEFLAKRDTILNKLIIGEKTVDEDYIRQIRQSSHDLRLEEERLSMCRQDITEAQNRLNSVVNEFKQFGKLAQNYDEVVSRLENAPKTRTRLLLPAGGVTAAFGALLLIAYFILGRSLILLIPSIFTLLTGAILVLLHFVIKRPDSSESIAKMYGIKNSIALHEALGHISHIKREIGNTQTLYNEAVKRKSSQIDECNKIKVILSDFCISHGIQTVNPSTIDMLCNNIEEDLHRIQLLDSRYEQLDERINGLLDGADEQELLLSSQNAPVNKPREIQMIESDLEQDNREYNRLNLEYVNAENEADNIFKNELTPAKIQEEIDEKQLELKNLKFCLEACEIAINALDDAFKELQMTFAPELNLRAGNYFNGLTQNSNRELLMDSNSNIRIKDNGIIRELSYFSAGTRDSAYFSVRLAAADLILKDERPALIFDDTFSRLDNSRLKLVMQILQRISANYQILLFTCRKEEKELADGDYNLINI